MQKVTYQSWYGSGDGQYYEDIGHMDWTKDDIKAQNVAAVYAVAKKFNETYPNVKINLFAKTGDPNAGRNKHMGSGN